MSQNPRELALQILQYLYEKAGKTTPISSFEVSIGTDIHSLRPAIEDLKMQGYVTEDEYRVEITPAGLNFARSKWV